MNRIKNLARQAAAEGIVLLENKENILPLKGGDEVAIFGRCQLDYYKSGTGSGGAVHVPYRTNIVDSLLEHPHINLNKDLIEVYKKWIKKNPFDDGGGGWAAEPWFQEEMPLAKELVEKSRCSSNKALVVIGRTAGEDQDNEDVAGSYRLTEKEENMIEFVTTYYKDVIIILNVSNLIDMSWMDKDYKHPIKGLLYAWQGGMEGGNGLVDILIGDVSPSGKLTDTIASKLSDYPSDSNYGHDKMNIYKEDIYVGYRYFNTFKPEKVRYPFGFGLSYTDFEIECTDFIVEKGEIVANISIRNVGNTSGKEVVQLYLNAPQGRLGKANYSLVDFIKTSELKPGETAKYSLSVHKYKLSSYDDSGVTGYKSSYIREEGNYNFYLGNSLNSLSKIGTYHSALEVVEELDEALAPKTSFKRYKAKLDNGKISLYLEDTPQMSIDMEKRIIDNLPKDLKHSKTSYKLEDVEKGKITMDDFIGQLSIEDLSALVKGEGMCSAKVTAGTASAFGGLTNALKEFGVPVLSCADGPSGIRMDSGKIASQVPIGTMLACSWNTELVEDLYEEIGKELVSNNIDTLLGPGMNIHRHPLNGRNFEYFSEDPIITGKFGSAVSKGLNRGGSSATLKHFLVNNQEVARSMADSVVSERALREIYLKGFEIAIKEGHASSIMTSYNPINGIYAASNYDLNTTILRNEWGFDGIVMTDWWAKVNHPVVGGKGNVFNKSYMVRAQNDLYMVVDNDEAGLMYQDDILQAYENGHLTLGELQRSAKSICSFILESHTYKSKYNHTGKSNFKPNKSPTYELNSIGEEITEHAFSISVESSGMFEIKTSARFKDSTLAQSSYNILVNEEIVAIAQMHGSDEDYLERNIAMIYLEKGYYDLKVEFIRKGIEVEYTKILNVK